MNPEQQSSTGLAGTGRQSSTGLAGTGRQSSTGLAGTGRQSSTAPGVSVGVSRRMWEALERYHGICYVAPEVREEATAAGLKGFWMNYFATRVAPLGPVGPDIVQATFFYYGPARVRRAIPDAWRFSSPEAAIAARYEAMERALGRLYGDSVESDDMIEAAELATQAVGGTDPIGRVLAAGWRSLGPPEGTPALALWHAATVLREYRSGNHLVAVCAEGLDGCEAVVSHVAAGGAPEIWIRDEAAWDDADVERATESLTRRGWLDETGSITDEGRAGRARLEVLTDALDAPVWERLGAERTERLGELLDSLVESFPPDDQLDWRTVYAEHDRHGAPGVAGPSGGN